MNTILISIEIYDRKLAPQYEYEGALAISKMYLCK